VIKRIPHEVIAALRADRAERINLDEDVREATSCADMCEATSARPGDDVRKGREAWRKGWHDPRYSREQHETWRKAWDDSRYSHRVSRDDVREVIYQLLWMGRFTRGIAGEDVHRDFYSRFVETMTCSNADETREAVDHALVRLNAIENQRAASKAE